MYNFSSGHKHMQNRNCCSRLHLVPFSEFVNEEYCLLWARLPVGISHITYPTLGLQVGADEPPHAPAFHPALATISDLASFVLLSISASTEHEQAVGQKVTTISAIHHLSWTERMAAIWNSHTSGSQRLLSESLCGVYHTSQTIHNIHSFAVHPSIKPPRICPL